MKLQDELRAEARGYHSGTRRLLVEAADRLDAIEKVFSRMEDWSTLANGGATFRVPLLERAVRELREALAGPYRVGQVSEPKAEERGGARHICNSAAGEYVDCEACESEQLAIEAEQGADCTHSRIIIDRASGVETCEDCGKENPDAGSAGRQ